MALTEQEVAAFHAFMEQRFAGLCSTEFAGFPIVLLAYSNSMVEFPVFTIKPGQLRRYRTMDCAKIRRGANQCCTIQLFNSGPAVFVCAMNGAGQAIVAPIHGKEDLLAQVATGVHLCVRIHSRPKPSGD